MIKQCVVCGKDFECKKNTAKYCSRSCENKARAKRIREHQQMGDIDKFCLICGKPFRPKTPSANKRTCCYECMPDGIQLGRSGFLDLIRKQRGGKCQRCGYNNYLGALEFHHLDPGGKDFTVGDRDFRLEDCIKETKKCVLICCNCHREVHAGLWDIKEILEKENKNE